MALSIKTDPSRAGGGYALLEGSGLAGVTAISVENCSSGQFLGEDGRWKKAPFAFPVEGTPSGGLSLGPHVVDFVPTELLVTLHAQDGRELGRLFWADVLPSRNPGSVTSTEVFEQRRRRAEDAARVEQGTARRAAEDEEAAKRAAEDADRRRVDADAEARRLREVAEADAAERAKTLERERELARQKEETERRRQEDLERKKHEPRPAWGRWAAVGLLILVLGATAAFALVPGLRDLFKPSQLEQRTETRVVETPSKPPVSPERKKAPPPVISTPQPPPVDCAQKFGGRLDGVQRLSDGEKVALGQEALHDGCGLAAFRAFDASAWESNEEAAWNVARFYDPNETRVVYRNVVQRHPDWAAVYYHYWRDRSARQSAALRTICDTANTGGASLRRSCSR